MELTCEHTKEKNYELESKLQESESNLKTMTSSFEESKRVNKDLEHQLTKIQGEYVV